ncbi:MAG: hypothetical protein LBC59_03890 [Chitinispirillales bacterium]|jgi:hypothetical protein|nr:hypothetical protein [Chitinispirillales bacterium]
MAGISVSADSFLRKVGAGVGVGGASDREGRKPGVGVAGKRQSVDEYVASLPAQAAFIGGKTLETLMSLPPVQKPNEQGAGGVGIGINTIGRTGFNAIGGIGVNDIGVVAVNTAMNTIEKSEPDEDVDTEEIDENGEAADEIEVGGAGSDKTGVAELTPDEQAVVNELRTIDREVRAHEQAHISAGGAYIRGAASYQYQRGPDNKSYAVGGEVGIDTAPERDDPRATITKMQAVRAAALAPADPSAQDRAVASAAAGNEGLARAELAEKERNGDDV